MPEPNLYFYILLFLNVILYNYKYHHVTTLVPRWHRGVKGEKIIGEGLNIDNLIMNELKHITGQSNFQVAHDVATAEQIWQAHRNVYERIGQADWAEAVYEVSAPGYFVVQK